MPSTRARPQHQPQHAVPSCAAYSASGDLQALNECLQSKYVCNSPTEQGEEKYMGYIKESLEVKLYSHSALSCGCLQLLF